MHFLRLYPIVLSSLLCSCYSLKLAWKQNNLINSRKPITDVILDPTEPESVRSQLMWLQQVMDFAEKSGLNTQGAYRYYVELDSPVVSYTVFASPVDSLTSITWWFPVVGSVPYIGFFDREEREEFAKELEGQGFDVWRSGVGAFSSLGWFADPVYSSMLKRSEASLAHLVFHELTHRTLWLPGSVEFNENLAEFIADKLTTLMLLELGKHEQLEAFRVRRQDEAEFRNWLIALRSALTEFYAKVPRDHQDFEFLRTEVIARQTKNRPKFDRFDFVGDRPWNNARIMASSLYAPNFETFERLWHCFKVNSVDEYLDKLEEYEDQLESFTLEANKGTKIFLSVSDAK